MFLPAARGAVAPAEMGGDPVWVAEEHRALGVRAQPPVVRLAVRGGMAQPGTRADPASIAFGMAFSFSSESSVARVRRACSTESRSADGDSGSLLGALPR